MSDLSISAIPQTMSIPTFVVARKKCFKIKDIKVFPISHYFTCGTKTFLLSFLLERLKVDHTNQNHLLPWFIHL